MQNDTEIETVEEAVEIEIVEKFAIGLAEEIGAVEGFEPVEIDLERYLKYIS